MAEKPLIVVENRFDASPDYVMAWLTDFRVDDGRYFQDAAPYKVLREGPRIRREQQSQLGLVKQVITLHPPSRWVAQSEILDAQGQVQARTEVRESVRAEGQGTVHRAEIFVTPVSPAFAQMLPQLAAGWEPVLRSGFATIKEELEAAARAGKAPTA